jgi:hypothetical protein
MWRMDATGTESGAAIENPPLGKCEHEGCTCTVATGERFCSDYCLAQAGTVHASSDHECACGHAECEHVMAAPTPVGITAP